MTIHATKLYNLKNYETAAIGCKKDLSGILPFLDQALSKVEITDPAAERLSLAIDMGEVVGKANCIKVSDPAKLKWAKMERSSRYIPLIDGEPEETRFITVTLVADTKGITDYLLIDAYFGPHTPPLPEDKIATEDSLDFWNRHALLFGTVPIIRDSITSDCPYKAIV